MSYILYVRTQSVIRVLYRDEQSSLVYHLRMYMGGTYLFLPVYEPCSSVVIFRPDLIPVEAMHISTRLLKWILTRGQTIQYKEATE